MGKQTRIPAVTSTVVLGLLAAVAVACSGGATGGTPTQADLQSSDGSVGVSSVTPAVGTAGPGGTPQGRPGGPPEAALLACADKTEGASCSFGAPWGDTIEGTCQSRPDDASQLACHPEERPGQGRPEGPPQELVAACEQKAAGQACSFVSPHGNAVDGICQAGPEGAAPLLCLPEGWEPGQAPGPGAPGGHAGPPEKALGACLGLTQGASCSFETPFGAVSGTCGIGRDGKSLVCVPVGASPR